MEFIVSIGLFGFVAALSFLLLAPKPEMDKEVIKRRLEAIAAGRKGAGAPSPLLAQGEATFWERLAGFFLGETELPERYTRARRLLHQAGYPRDRAIYIFLGIRIFMAASLGGAAILFATLSLLPLPNMLALAAASAALGYLLPFLYVRGRARLRTREIQETFPDTLDLLVVCVEAGLGVDAALVRVASEQAGQRLAIGAELELMIREMQAGVSRRLALSRLADRTGLDDVRSFTNLLIQTEELGGSIAGSFRVYAQTMRHKRSQKAEEAARKAVIKLLFPLALFILPALLLVILAPPAMNLIKFVANPMGK